MYVTVQAAFKKTPTATGLDSADVAAAMDWDQVKPEDRTLVDQASLHNMLDMKPMKAPRLKIDQDSQVDVKHMPVARPSAHQGSFLHHTMSCPLY